MRRLLDTLYKASGILAALFLLCIVVIVFLQVCLNLADKISAVVFNRALGLTIPSYSDFTGFFLAASSFMALAYTLRAGGHIRVTLVSTLLAKNTQRWLIGIVLFTGLLMAGYAAVYMILLVRESITYGDKTSGMLSIPLWLPQIFVALGLVVFTIALLDDLVEVIMGKKASFEDKGENLLGE